MRLFIRLIRDYADADHGLLEPERRKKLARIQKEHARLECIATGILLREALAEYGYAVPDGPLDVDYVENGKPFIAGAPCFSLSHSGELVVCAVCDKPVGADVQVVRAISSRVAKRILSDEEYAEYKSLCGDAEKSKQYLTVRWSEKESIAKLLGKGLGADFRLLRAADYDMNTVVHVVDGTEYAISVARYRK